jgi:hypothetical protein
MNAAKRKPKPRLRKADVLHGYRHGWAVFRVDTETKPYFGYQLQGLNDPVNACRDNGVTLVKRFDRTVNVDRNAARYVQRRAEAGDEACRRAVEFLIAYDSPDVELFKLRKTW